MTTTEYQALMTEVLALKHEVQAIHVRQNTLLKRQNAMLLAICVIIAWLGAVTYAGDLAIAVKDRQRFPVHEHPYIYYFGVGHLPPERQEETAKVLAFAVCSCTRAVVIEHQLPIKVSNTVYRIDTRALGWQHAFPRMLQKYYPYSAAPGRLSLLVKADWFIQLALDQDQAPEVYYELLYGKAPQTLKEFRSLLEVTPGTAYQHGHIEATSGVSVQGTRLITTTPTAGRSDVWETYDAAVIAGDTDPLEHLDRTQKFDAQEIIGSLPKSLAATGDLGSLQVYALANSQGNLQDKAPSNIVVDHTGVRGVEIRNPVSCMVCHEPGLNPLKENALRKFIESGAEAYADYQQQLEIERFHLTSLQKLITRHNQDYAIIIQGINGLTPQENALALKRVIQDYDAPLDLARAGRELWSNAGELQLALGFVGHLPARAAQLAQDGKQTISRESFELHSRQLQAAVNVWRKQVR